MGAKKRGKSCVYVQHRVNFRDSYYTVNRKECDYIQVVGAKSGEADIAFTQVTAKIWKWVNLVNHRSNCAANK